MSQLSKALSGKSKSVFSVRKVLPYFTYHCPPATIRASLKSKTFNRPFVFFRSWSHPAISLRRRKSVPFIGPDNTNSVISYLSALEINSSNVPASFKWIVRFVPLVSPPGVFPSSCAPLSVTVTRQVALFVPIFERTYIVVVPLPFAVIIPSPET